ncbi:MAG: cephalosporin hydroxylase family protein [Deltaproteobacteria bacterium]|nr:cephalosporin hydroxylase family protein [Deltaproteobacteria bacterium]
MNDREFEEHNRAKIEEMGKDDALREVSRQFLHRSVQQEYSYHFRWLGRPIIQYPQDVIAMQELIWQIKPDAIVETGIARGGSLIFYASMLHLLGQDGIVVGVDIDVRPHNRVDIEAHPMARYVQMIEGSSIDPDIVAEVRTRLASRKRVLVVLDSMHTHAHVLRELELYSPFVTNGSYLVVFDTCIEQLPADLYPERPWGPGNNPWTATQEFLRTTDRFVVDHAISDKLQITVAPDGYLKCVADQP